MMEKVNHPLLQSSLFTPDQAALHHGIARTDLKVRLGILSDALVSEASHSDEEDDIAGPCMEALLEGDCEFIHLALPSQITFDSDDLCSFLSTWTACQAHS